MAGLDIVKMWLAELRQSSIDLRTDTYFSEDPSHNVFLSPHHDDICFSLGASAHRLQAGILLNVFSKSGHIARFDMAPKELAARFKDGSVEAQSLGKYPRTQAAEDWVNWITGLRKAEDQAFADACRLRLVELGLPEAPLRAQDPFKGQISETDSAEVEASLMTALADVTPPANAARPWLFCPAGIGGHIDHLLVRNAVMKQLGTLRRTHRVAFYEDLHYASDRSKRWKDLAKFLDTARDLKLARIKLPMDGRADLKLALIRLYSSQLTQELSVISRFSPASLLGTGLHEAVWVPRRSGPSSIE
ncbi:MAG: hypothetical protein WCF20_04230 [Methylovirgula sp.]